MDQFQSAFNGPAANIDRARAGHLSPCLAGSGKGLRGNERYARRGRRRRAHAGAAPTLLVHLACLLLPVAVTLLALGVPLITLIRWLVIGGAGIWHAEVATAFLQTVVLAVVGGLLATITAMPMAWLSVRSPGRDHLSSGKLPLLCRSLPGVVVALALVTLAVHAFLPLYQTMATLLLAYLLLFLPRALVGLRSSVAQTPVELEQAAMTLGRSPLRAVLAATVRLAAPGAAASIALVGWGSPPN